MKRISIITPEQVAERIKDNHFVTGNVFLASVQSEALTSALERRFLQTRSPGNLTRYYAGQGNSDGRGGEHFVSEGLLKRVILGHGRIVSAMVNVCKMEAYNFPQGTLAQYYRDVTAHQMGT